MAHSEKTKARARTLYIYQRRTLDSIARELRADRATVLRWKRLAREAGDDWERAKAAASLAGEGAESVAVRFLEDFVLLLEQTMTELKAGHGKMTAQQRVDALAKLADSYGKATLAVQRSLPKISELAVAMEVLQTLERFIAERMPQHRRALSEVLEPFGHELARRYG